MPLLFCPMPFASTQQSRWAFATGQPFAKRWAKMTNYRRLPVKKRKKAETPHAKVNQLWTSGVKKSDITGIWYSPSDDTWFVSGGDWAESGTGDKVKAVFGPDVIWADEGVPDTKPGSSEAKFTQNIKFKAFTVDQLEAFVSSPAYDPATAGLIALGIPALPRFKGEQIAPGITRIHGNLCNVHGKYGPCDKSLSGKKPKKGRTRKPAKAKLTPEQRVAQRDQEHQANRGKTLTQQGYSTADQTALEALRSGAQPAKVSQSLIDQGVVEQAQDGSYRLTGSGRALMNAAGQADAGRARDTVSGARDRVAARRQRLAEHAKRQQDAAGKRASAQMGRELAKREREQAHAKRQAEAAKKPAGGGGKKPEKPAVEKPLRAAPARRRQSASAPSVSGSYDIAPKKPAAPKPEKAPAKQLAPALQEAAQSLSDGKKLSEADTQSLIRNGLARLVKGELVLTAAGMRATQKAYSFRVFKDARGQYRWVAQSSTAFQDRDKEIVSTKALADDCAFADRVGSYGPLRWWHTPGLDLGDCDFNAMHGRVLIESGTFRTPSIAQKVAAAADGLEISLGFLHLPTEPDASGVFHHIRRFERSLVPRGKASNRFTAFRVKEIPMLDATKVAALKTLGFSDADIAGLQTQAAATEKAAEEQQVAYKADEPAPETAAELPDLVINGVTYKAMPPMLPGNAAEDAADQGADDAQETPVDDGTDAGGLTLSPEDLGAIGQAVGDALQGAVAQIMGALDLEKKVGAHVAGLMAPYTAQKDASDAEKAEAIAALQTSLKVAQEQQAATQAKLNELLGLQPAVKAERASESPTTTINPWIPSDQQLLAAVKDQVPADQQFAFGDLVQNLFGQTTPGQA